MLDLVERVPHDLDLSEVRLLAAEAAHHVGDPDRARELLELVRADTDDPHTRALAAERIGALHLMYGDGEAGERAFAEALALVPEGETSVLAARIQGGLALLGVGWSRLDDAELAGTEGLRIARAVGARREEGIALNALGTTAALRGDLGRAVDMLREALEIAREVEDPWDLGAAYVNLSHVLGMAGRLDECVELGRVGIVELTRFGQQRVQGSLLLNNVSEILVEAGRFDEAGALVAEALSRHPRGIRAAPLLRLRRAHRDGQRRPDHRLGALRTGPTGARVRDRTGLVDAHRGGDRRGDRPVGGPPRGGLRRGGRRPRPGGRHRRRGSRRHPGRARACARWPTRPPCTATAGRARGWRRSATGSRRLSSSCRPTPPPAVSPTTRPCSAGWRPRARGTTGTRSATSGPRPPWPGPTCGGRSGRRTHAGARPRPGSRWASRRTRSGRCGPRTRLRRRWEPGAWSRRSRRSARWYRADLLPAEVEERSDDPLAAYGLTEREREVLAALAAGHTNREIADDAVHQREDGVGARVEHPAQAGRGRAAGGGPDRAPAGRRGGGGLASARGDHPRHLSGRHPLR